MAASLGNYYIDGPTLSTASAVYTDVDLTICASDGFYSDGTVCRQQIGCVLTIATPCPSCFAPCDSTINTGGATGVYKLTFDTGENFGAMIIYFNPQSVPDGIRAVFDSVTYNKLTCSLFGLAQAASGNLTVAGAASSDCSPSVGITLDAGGYSGLDEFTYNPTTQVYDNVGSSGTATGTSADVFLESSAPGYYTLVIPRATNTAFSCEVEVVGYCGTAWDLEISCPAALPSIPINLTSDDCTTTSFPTFFYVAPNRGNTAGEPSVNEFAFADSSGVTQTPAGTYVMNPPSGKKLVTVDVNGIITNITACP
jgi:hypothetical protein